MSYSSADKAALKAFVRKQVSSEMVSYLVSTTNSVIRVKPQPYQSSYPTPPSTPLDPKSQSKLAPSIVPLTVFIENIIKYSNVQTPTLMSTLVYLTRLRAILPPTSYGIETTRHRVLLGCLILAAKNLNDSSPLNKHWTQYTDGLLSIKEVNTIERELLSYLNWDLRITNTDLINCFAPFLAPIKEKMRKEANKSLMKLTQKQYQYQYQYQQQAQCENLGALQNSSSYSSINSSSSMTSVPGLMASSSSNTIASSTSSIPTPSSSVLHLNRITDNSEYHLQKQQHKDDFKPRPLRLRSSTDNLSNIAGQQMHLKSKPAPAMVRNGKENDHSRSSRGFSFLAGAGRIIS